MQIKIYLCIIIKANNSIEQIIGQQKMIFCYSKKVTRYWLLNYYLYTYFED